MKRKTVVTDSAITLRRRKDILEISWVEILYQIAEKVVRHGSRWNLFLPRQNRRLAFMSVRIETLLLAFVSVVARYMALDNVGCDAAVIPDEPVDQSCTGEVGFRLRKDTLLRPSIHADKQLTARETNLNRAGALDIRPLVEARIFRHDLGSDLHRRFLLVRRLSDPVLLSAVIIFVADGFEQLRVGSQLRSNRHGPSLGVSAGILERHGYFQVAEIDTAVALRHAQRLSMGVAVEEPGPVIKPRT